MSENVITDDILSNINELLEDCRKKGNMYITKSYARKQDAFTPELLNLALGGLNLKMTIAYELILHLVNSINKINSAIDKLPDREEFDSIKTELKKEVKETLGPLKEDYQKWKDRQKHGEDLHQ